MKIIWLTIDALLPMNTAGRMGVLKRLETVAANNDVYLFYFYDEKNDNDETNCKLSQSCKEVNGYIKTTSKLSLVKNILRYPYTVSTRINETMIRDIDKCIIDNDIELINIDFPQMGYALYRLKNSDNLKIIMNQHNIEWMRFKEMSKSKSISLLKRFIMRIEGLRLKHFEETLYTRIRFDAQTFVTQEDKSIFTQWTNLHNTRLEIFQGGGYYKKESIIEKKTSKEKSIIFVGVMSNEFNPEGALWFAREVLPRIKQSIDNVKFYIIGKDPIEKLKTLSDSSIIVTGFVEDLDVYYQLADIVVIPILHGGGVKLKLLEAMGYNKIVVSTSQGVRGTDFIDGESILIADDAKEFAKKCISVLNDPVAYDTLKKNAEDIFLSKYTWESIGAKYNKFLMSL